MALVGFNDMAPGHSLFEPVRQPDAVCPRCRGLGMLFPAPLFGCADPCALCDRRGVVEADVLAAWRAARLAGAPA
ncbi:MAG TPA: hypothetical protein VGI39_03220 [Polyangiaceae bacterium]|jgi:hypothetical protein